jgi:hypothetical protein
MTVSRIASFMARTASDHKQRTLDCYWRSNDVWREQTHDYIQWAFPMPTPSPHNPDAPILREIDAMIIRNSPEATANFRRTIFMMEQFYQANPRWLMSHNHNHQRITRILKSARLILPNTGDDVKFYSTITLMTRRGEVNDKSIAMWASVVSKRQYTFEDALEG